MDDEEMDRFQQQHFIVKHVCGNRNYLAPIEGVLRAGSKILVSLRNDGHFKFYKLLIVQLHYNAYFPTWLP